MGKRHKLGERQAYILSRERHGVGVGRETDRRKKGERVSWRERQKVRGIYTPVNHWLRATLREC